MESAPLESPEKRAAPHIGDASPVLLLLLQQSSKQVRSSRVREARLVELRMKAHDHLEEFHQLLARLHLLIVWTGGLERQLARQQLM